MLAYLLAYPIVGLGLLAFIRARRRTRDPGGLLDSAILTAALGCCRGSPGPTDPRGLVPPADFIPTVELSPLIRDLDTWVLRHAAAQLVTWLAAGHPETTMSVNISGRHVSLPRVIDDVRDTLAGTGLPARLLVLEITETVLIEPRAVRHLHLLREMGVGVSIDDFGTGYNSVGRLTDFPVDTVKIDRSFLPTAQNPSIAQL